MRELLEKRELKKLDFPVCGYGYNVQIVRSVDGGASWFYCGNGKYFKTEDEAKAFASEN